ncbi:MAG: type II secretion system protein GspM [Gammaproteobacteria bacterium]|nr:type II secretion system protein GspM [Gammaproteobacteria bacterium]
MKLQWQTLSLREKKAAIIGGLALACLILFATWEMLANQISDLQENVAHNKTLLAWMQQADAELKKTHLSTGSHPANPMTLVQTAINQSSLATHVNQLKQTDNNSIQLNFKDASFDDIIQLLTHLWQESQLIVTQAQMANNKDPGIVNASITLEPT